MLDDDGEEGVMGGGRDGCGAPCRGSVAGRQFGPHFSGGDNPYLSASSGGEPSPGKKKYYIKRILCNQLRVTE